MKIIYNRLIPFRGYAAMMFFGVIFARPEYRPLPPRIINHEAIHAAQARDCHGFLLFYLRYLGGWIRYGYERCPFEREAYASQGDPDYLKHRAPGAWKSYRG